jgi:hypothetical protein
MGGISYGQRTQLHFIYGNLTPLRDAVLLGTVSKEKPYLRLANKKKRLRWEKEHRHWTEELCLEGQHPGVASSLLRLVFCGYYLMNLPVEDL